MASDEHTRRPNFLKRIKRWIWFYEIAKIRVYTPRSEFCLRITIPFIRRPRRDEVGFDPHMWALAGTPTVHIPSSRLSDAKAEHPDV